MRVIAGQYRGQKLVAPKGVHTRPTGDRIKENIFNMLGQDLTDTVVVDLFAGSGALGIEALSRGASHATFVEQNTEALKCIQQNLTTLKIPSTHFSLTKCEVSTFLQSKKTLTSKDDAKFFVVFADPPYASSWYDNALQKLNDFCPQGTVFVLEGSSEQKNRLTPSHQKWELEKSRIYGKTCIEIWKKRE